MIETAVKDELRDFSIFRKKAIRSDFSFINLNGFPLHKIVYNEYEERQLNAHIFRLLRSTNEVKKLGYLLEENSVLIRFVRYGEDTYSPANGEHRTPEWLDVYQCQYGR